jgi:hypothetical protein
MKKNNRLRNELERIDIHESGHLDVPDLIVIKGTPRLLMGKYNHDIGGCAELYIAFHTLCDEWSVGTQIGSLIPDRVMVYEGTKFYFEMDMGNMKPDLLFDKVDRYVQFAGTGEKVIFVLKDGAYKVDQTGSRLMDYLKERRLGNFITAAKFENLIRFPLGDVLSSPLVGRISIPQLCASS